MLCGLLLIPLCKNAMNHSLPLIGKTTDNHCTQTVPHNPGGGDEAPLHVVAVDHGQSDDHSQDIRDQEEGDQWTPSFLRLGIKKRNLYFLLLETCCLVSV